MTEANRTVLPWQDKNAHLIPPGSWCTLVARQTPVSLLAMFPRGANETDQTPVTLQTERQNFSIQNNGGVFFGGPLELKTHFLPLAARISPQSRKSRRPLWTLVAVD